MTDTGTRDSFFIKYMPPEFLNDTKPAKDKTKALQSADESDFRDHLATADKEGRRRWLYPRKVHGRFYRWRTRLSWVLLAVMLAGPFITIHGNPLLLVNVVERKFVVLGQVFWPQDMILFAIAILVLLTSLVVFTAAFGRVWCGWACPQTVIMEMVFRKIEYWIEGDAHQQRVLNQAPWTGSKMARKILKHALFLAVSFLVGHILLTYIIGWREVFHIVTDPPSKHWVGLGFMVAFTLLFYGIFARFREQACTFICPYGRFQSVLLDENSIVVAYDHKRGEKRGHLRRDQGPDERQAAGLGDCVACNQCVAVCPTGIDIRNGTQMECVHCTACIDACNEVMTRTGRPGGLIRYASLNGIERGERLQFTPRLAGYVVLLLILSLVLGLMVFLRSDVQATLLRAPGALFQQMPDGQYSNLYTLRLINKTSQPMQVDLRLEKPAGSLTVVGRGGLTVPPQMLSEYSVLIELNPDAMKSGVTPLVLGVYSRGKEIETLETSFIGPRH